MKKSANSEAGTQRAILDLLAAEKIFALRMNSGAMSGSHKGKRWYVRFGLPGCADVLAFPSCDVKSDGGCLKVITPLWIETKSITGIQSELQKSFERYVTSKGHAYVLARRVDDIVNWLTENVVR